VRPWLGARAGPLPPHPRRSTLVTPNLTGHDIAQRHNSGARITTTPANGNSTPGTDILFLITPEGAGGGPAPGG
jgi:hypothetical protein